MAVKGLDRLNRQIKALPELAVAAARDALHKGAEEMAEAMRRAVPVDRGDLSASIAWSVGDAPEGAAFSAGGTAKGGSSKAALNEAGLRVTVHAGNRQTFYARYVEFGTAPARLGERMGARSTDVNQNKGAGRKSYRSHAGTKAQPFFFPTIRMLKKRVRNRVIRNGNKAAKAAAAK